MENFEYKGVQYSVYLSEGKKGDFSWSITVGNHFEEMRDRPIASRNAILGEAKDAAIRHIEWMMKNKST